MHDTILTALCFKSDILEMNVQGSMPRSFHASLGIEPGAVAVQPLEQSIRLSDCYMTVPKAPTDFIGQLIPQMKLDGFQRIYY